MHRAWLIDEILLLILEYLDRPSLAALARTCKGLFVPVTDELWKTLQTVAPFLDCLPPDIMKRPLQAKDIVRLDMYGDKVHILELEGTFHDPLQIPERWKGSKRKGTDFRLWGRAWENIASARPQARFLPNLRSLRVNHADGDLLLPLVGISGKHLKKVWIKYLAFGRKGSGNIKEVLSNLQDYSKLEDVFVRNGGHTYNVPTRLVLEAPLKRLAVPSTIFPHRKAKDASDTYPIRQEILEKSSLENITVSLNREWCPVALLSSEKKYLPNLKYLWLDIMRVIPFNPGEYGLHGWNEETVPERLAVSQPWNEYSQNEPATTFFERLDNPELTLLNIKFPHSVNPDQLLATVAAARSNCRLRNLEELSLAGEGEGTNHQQYYHYSTSFIPPNVVAQGLISLLPLYSLRSLRLSVSPSFLSNLDLNLFRSIASGVPALEILRLTHPLGPNFRFDHYCYVHRDEMVPISNVVAFCSKLPKLVEITLGVVSVLPEAFEEAKDTDWVCPNVEIFSVCKCKGAGKVPMENTLLEKWFPKIDELNWAYDSSADTFMR